MRKLVLSVFALALVAAVASPALAQPPGGGRGFGGGMSGMMLLGQKSVQEDLKLSDDQIKKVQEYNQKALAGFRDLQGLSQEERTKKLEDSRKEGEKFLADTLKPEQAKRLKEISFQQAMKLGMGAVLNNQEYAKDLNLTDEQKDKIKAMGEDARKFREELGIQRGQRPTEEQQKKQADFRKGQDEKYSKMLTEDQKAKLKTLAGAEFKGEITPFGGRRPGGGGGAGGARPPRP
jgi:Spy/CpxP family protein refolding chaperone